MIAPPQRVQDTAAARLVLAMVRIAEPTSRQLRRKETYLSATVQSRYSDALRLSDISLLRYSTFC